MMPKPRLGANDYKMTHTLSCLSSMQTPGQPALISLGFRPCCSSLGPTRR